MFAFALLDRDAPAAVPRARRLRHQAALPATDARSSSRSRPRSARWRTTARGRSSVDPPLHAHVPARRLRPVARHARSPASRSSRPGRCYEIDLETRRDARPRRSTAWRRRRIDDARPDALLEQLRELLNASVRRHLMADVPTGLFLSGGLDSSALDVLRQPSRRAAQDVLDRLLGVGSRRRDAVRGGGRAPRRQRERPHRSRARRTSAISTRSSTRWRSRWPTAPCCRSGTCAAGTAAHVKVALSGEGGDEVLGGYARYFWGPVVDDLRPLLLRARGRGAAASRPRCPSRSLGIFNVARRAAKLADSVALDTPRATCPGSTSSRPTNGARWSATGHDGAAERYEALFAAARELRLDPVQRLQYVDFQTMLLDNLLMKADKISMAHSLEVRVPFLAREPGRVRAGAAAAVQDRPAARQAPDAPAAATRSWGRGSPTGRSAASRSPSTAGFARPATEAAARRS